MPVLIDCSITVAKGIFVLEIDIEDTLGPGTGSRVNGGMGTFLGTKFTSACLFFKCLVMFETVLLKLS